MPHAELIVPIDSIFNYFKGKYVEDKPFVLQHNYLSDYVPNFKELQYSSQPHPHAAYAEMVTRLDNYVGQIIDKLEQLGISDNTLVIFTSDIRPSVEGGADPDFFNGTAGLRDLKRDLYEGGIRSPFLAV